jgi:hypothetical protein
MQDPGDFVPGGSIIIGYFGFDSLVITIQPFPAKIRDLPDYPASRFAGYLIYLPPKNRGEDKMFNRWPWRRSLLTRTPRRNSSFRIPETIWMGDMKKTAEWGACLYERKQFQEAARLSGKSPLADQF